LSFKKDISDAYFLISFDTDWGAVPVKAETVTAKIMDNTPR
jgi:hypothetical protein